MTATFEVLGEATRRRILDLLAEEERPVGDLVAMLSLSQPAVSKHLKVLRDAGLVEARTDAQRRIYRVRTEPLREVDDWLEPYRRRGGGLARAVPPPVGRPPRRAGASPRLHGRRHADGATMTEEGGTLERAGGLS